MYYIKFMSKRPILAYLHTVYMYNFVVTSVGVQAFELTNHLLVIQNVVVRNVLWQNKNFL